MQLEKNSKEKTLLLVFSLKADFFIVLKLRLWVPKGEHEAHFVSISRSRVPLVFLQVK